MSEIKIPALKIEFIDQLYNKWYDEYQDSTIEDFLDYVEDEYGEIKDEFIVPGDTGVYLDEDAAFLLRTNVQGERTKAEWDLESALILFGEETPSGLYSYDKEGNKCRLNAVQSSDIRIWNCLSLFILKDYTKKRWGDSKDTVRLFVNSLTNGKVSRHAIMRLYWSALICYDLAAEDKLELLPILWKSQDFMTQVTERGVSGMRHKIRSLLRYCSREENETVFTDKSSEGYVKYRKFIKLYLADSNVLALDVMDDQQIEALFDENLEACS